MTRFKVKSIYNTPEVEATELMNIEQEITVEWENSSDNFKMDIVETEFEYDEFHRLVASDTRTNTEYFDATAEWVLMLESPKMYYAAFHALATGYNGSHMSYMLINEPEILEED